MARTVGIGIQSFDKIIEGNYFYVDKTSFIKEWWESGDDVTLITRPRRFGKTLNMSMIEQFFSIKYEGREDLFERLSIWDEKKYQQLQGTYPVISLSFANVKERDYASARKKICQLLTKLYAQYSFLLDSGILYKTDVDYFHRVSENMDDSDATLALYQLSDFLQRYYGKKVIILLDEYDTPMQEAYIDGYWQELLSFTRSLFNATFKTNPFLERGIMTGITRVSKESIFSDLNNLKIVTTTSNEYATSFGFTEEEVFAGLEECGLAKEKEKVKWWYDGFSFGNQQDIYNPWSVLNFLDTGKYGTYWANTSANSLVDRLIRQGDRKIKENFEKLLNRESILCPVDEQIMYDQLNGSEKAIWSLLLAGGYLKVISHENYDEVENGEQLKYELAITNHEVKLMFHNMVRDWFSETGADYSDFVEALLLGDIDAMNEYMNRVSEQIFSTFDVGRNPSRSQPERFYHGFVLGLITELMGKYEITSNRESGFGRYDVVIESKKKEQAIIIEFKVFNQKKEKTLEDTLQAAHNQIDEKKYDVALLAKGFTNDQIHKYGFAFEGKKVLIG